jgi:nucleotide-binding universal stress UspA family protein
MNDVSGDRANEIVVAVDGSRPSLAALAWAVGQARSAGREICAVRVFDPTFLYSPPAPAFESIAVARAEERDALERDVAAAVGAGPDVPIRTELIQGQPAIEIVRRCDGAAMLVLGSHGRGRVGSTLLGSVGAACVRKAACPVVVIPPHAADPLLGAAGGATADTAV